MSRITPGTLIVGIFAILFGLVGAYIVRKQLNSAPEAKAEAAPRLVRIPMAATDLAPDRTLTLGDIVIMSYTPEQLKKQKLPSEYMANAQQIIGRTLREPMQKGSTFTTTLFYPEGIGPDVSRRLRPGLRAVAVNIDATGGVNGLAVAGAMVDVLFRTNADTKNDRPETTVTLLENVEVLAVGENFVPGTKNTAAQKTVTLAASAQQVSALKIAEGKGVFSLSLRNPDDNGLAGGSGPRTLDKLLDLPERFTSEIYRGANKQTITFKDGQVVESRETEVPVARNGRGFKGPQVVGQTPTVPASTTVQP
jgi:Flp pilus assembly protein CpaB